MASQNAINRRAFLKYSTLAVSAGALLAACAGAPPAPTAAPKATEPAKPAAAAAPTSAPAAQPTSAPAAPAATPAAKPASAQGGTIQVMTWFAADSPARIVNTKIMKEYVDKKPGLNFEVQDVPFANYQQKLQTIYAANQGPDLLYISIWRIGPLAKANRLIALDTIYQGDKGSPQYLKGVLDDGKVQGKLYGIPVEASTWVLLFNRTMFEKAGMKTPDQLDQEGKWNQAAAVEAAKQLTKSEGGRVSVYGWLSEPQVYTWATYAYGAGGQFMDGGKTKFTVNQPQNVEALQWLGDMINVHKVAPGLTDTQQEGYLPRLTNQRLAMTNNWAVYLADLKKAIADKWEPDIYFAPYNKQKAGWTHSNLIALSAGTKFQDQCWDLTKALSGADGVKARLAVGYGETPLLDDPSVAEAFTKNIPGKHNSVVNELMKPEARIPLPYNDNWEEQRYNALEPGMQAVWLGKSKASEIMAKMESDLNDKLPK